MKKRVQTLMFLVPTLVFAGLLCYSVFRALSIYIPQEMERRVFVELKKSIQTAGPERGEEGAASGDGTGQEWNPYSALLERNGDFVGWLTIEDSKIDYPVMKASGDDPEFYLHRDFDGKDSSSGCLFIGGDCYADSESFIIYGHKMNNDSMFGTLDSYAEDDFAAQHSEIRFSTPTEKRTYRVFAAFQTKVYRERTDLFQYYEEVGDLGEEEYQHTVDSIRTMSILHLPDAPVYPAQLLFLSTCSYHTEDGRFVVAAYRVQ